MFLELGNLANTCEMPSKEDLMSATINNKIDWNVVESFLRGEDQSLEAFNEQTCALNACEKSIDSHVNVAG